MEFHWLDVEKNQQNSIHWLPENTVEIDQAVLREITEKICTDKKCRYPLLALRILLHAICEMDSNGRVYICAKKLAAKLDVNYDTITKCIKYLRVSDILTIEKRSSQLTVEKYEK